MRPATSERARGGPYLADFTLPAVRCREGTFGFAEFRQLEKARQLGWPDDVLEQWVYDHAGNDSFLADYGEIDLSNINWQVEDLPLADFIVMPTGPSDVDAIEHYAENPDHWIAVRRHGVHLGVKPCWEVHGTWKRWPILLDRDLITPGDRGLQLVEGRTRVGILRGRRREPGRGQAPGMGRTKADMSSQRIAAYTQGDACHPIPGRIPYQSRSLRR